MLVTLFGKQAYDLTRALPSRCLAFRLAAPLVTYTQIENFGGFLTASLLAGLHYPIATAVLGAGWILGAYTYASNYTYKGAKTRYDGAGKLVRLCFFALLLLNIELAFSLILETPLLAAYLL